MPEEHPSLFHPDDIPLAPKANARATFRPLDFPIWTQHKAALIARYLRYFVFITRHGTYIDGFAGPQNRHAHMWAAEQVLKSEPKWLRHFHLAELNGTSFAALEALKASETATPRRERTIDLYRGDFNETIEHILASGHVTPKEATFCLLDQRTFECEWSTVARLARFKPPGEHKIELFYFLAIGWLNRALAATKYDKRLERWWGRPDWSVLRQGSPHEKAERLVDRIKTEFGYASVMAWPIRRGRNSSRIMYFMIHASDHVEAPKLMRRAYERAVDPPEPIEQLCLEYEADHPQD